MYLSAVGVALNDTTPAVPTDMEADKVVIPWLDAVSFHSDVMGEAP